MPIDVNWQARMGIFDSSKSLLKTETKNIGRGGSRTAATSKMEHFVIIVNGF